MNSDEFDAKMRAYETANDTYISSDMYAVARLDGRNFTRLTKEICAFEKPFDPKFKDMMLETTRHLMSCGFNVTYAYTQSDEISLLFNQSIDAYNGKFRKFNSVLAGEASAKFSLLLGQLAVLIVGS